MNFRTDQIKSWHVHGTMRKNYDVNNFSEFEGL